MSDLANKIRVSDKINGEYTQWKTAEEYLCQVTSISETLEILNKNNITYHKLRGHVNYLPGNTVYLDAHTGSGKTYFILHVLLQHAIEHNKTILYLVNRKILKEQIKSEIEQIWKGTGRVLYSSYDTFINVVTYQEVEHKIKNENRQNIFWRNYTYVIFDECHYFYTDSTYNTNTELSFVFLMERFRGAIKIFASATLECVEKYFKDYIVSQELQFLKQIEVQLDAGQAEKCQQLFLAYQREYSYKMEPDYSYVNLAMIFDVDELIEHIKLKPKEKWLIFINNIQKCEQVKKQIEKENEGVECRLITSKYREDEETLETVDKIVEEGLMNADVIIATSVLDNGISLDDYELKNLVVSDETKENFIQMLGRKRRDDQEIYVYHLKQDAQVYSSRLNNARRMIEFIGKNNQWVCNYQPVVCEISRNNIQMNSQILDSYFYMKQSFLLEKILNNVNISKCSSRICYEYAGLLYMNKFAKDKYYSSYKFYQNLKDELLLDQLAIFKMQNRWLGIPDEVMRKNEKTLKERMLDKFIELIESNLDVEIDTEKILSQNLEVFFYLAERIKGNGTILNTINRKRGFGKKSVNAYFETYKLPYKYEQTSGAGIGIITKIQPSEQ